MEILSSFDCYKVNVTKLRTLLSELSIEFFDTYAASGLTEELIKTGDKELLCDMVGAIDGLTDRLELEVEKGKVKKKKGVVKKKKPTAATTIHKAESPKKKLKTTPSPAPKPKVSVNPYQADTDSDTEEDTSLQSMPFYNNNRPKPPIQTDNNNSNQDPVAACSRLGSLQNFENSCYMDSVLFMLLVVNPSFSVPNLLQKELRFESSNQVDMVQFQQEIKTFMALIAGTPQEKQWHKHVQVLDQALQNLNHIDSKKIVSVLETLVTNIDKQFTEGKLKSRDTKYILSRVISSLTYKPMCVNQPDGDSSRNSRKLIQDTLNELYNNLQEGRELQCLDFRRLLQLCETYEGQGESLDFWGESIQDPIEFCRYLFQILEVDSCTYVTQNSLTDDNGQFNSTTTRTAGMRPIIELVATELNDGDVILPRKIYSHPDEFNPMIITSQDVRIESSDFMIINVQRRIGEYDQDYGNGNQPTNNNSKNKNNSKKQALASAGGHDGVDGVRNQKFVKSRLYPTESVQTEDGTELWYQGCVIYGPGAHYTAAFRCKNRWFFYNDIGSKTGHFEFIGDTFQDLLKWKSERIPKTAVQHYYAQRTTL